MGSWIKRDKGWLHSVPRQHPEPAKEESGVAVETENKPPVPVQYGVVYHPLRCPKCHSKDIKTYACKPPVRYHKCKICGINFKSTETDA